MQTGARNGQYRFRAPVLCSPFKATAPAASPGSSGPAPGVWHPAPAAAPPHCANPRPPSGGPCRRGVQRQGQTHYDLSGGDGDGAFNIGHIGVTDIRKLTDLRLTQSKLFSSSGNPFADFGIVDVHSASPISFNDRVKRSKQK